VVEVGATAALATLVAVAGTAPLLWPHAVRSSKQIRVVIGMDQIRRNIVVLL
jgi:hypothetical protein